MKTFREEYRECLELARRTHNPILRELALRQAKAFLSAAMEWETHLGILDEIKVVQGKIK